MSQLFDLKQVKLTESTGSAEAACTPKTMEKILNGL